jgi:hypothetical protein
MDYQQPSQPFPPLYTPQPPFPLQYGEHLGTEKLFTEGYMHWFPLSYSHGGPLLNQMVQPQSNNAVFQQGSFSQNQVSLLPYSIPSSIVAQPSDVHVQPMAPPATSRKRKAPTLRDEDWEPVRARVIELHITQNLPLPEVKMVVEEEFKSFGFTATLVNCFSIFLLLD